MTKSKFAHEEIYRGKEAIQKISNKKITVCGAGALGSNLIDNLTRTGFRSIKVIDFDRVELGNLNTQIWNENEIGALKADTLKNRCFRSVGAEIESISKELMAGNVKNFLKGSDLVVDVFDNSKSRQLVQTECRERKLPCLHGGLFEDFGSVIWDEKYTVPRDAEGDVCDYPLARNSIMLVVAILSEEILDFCIAKQPRKANWTVTLKDLCIRKS